MVKTIWKTNETGIQGPFKVANSDRLLLGDIDKHDAARQQAVGDEGQYWDDVDPQKIESFLSTYFDKQVQLLAVQKDEDLASGQPVWTFHYKDKEPVQP